MMKYHTYVIGSPETATPSAENVTGAFVRAGLREMVMPVTTGGPEAAGLIVIFTVLLSVPDEFVAVSCTS
jgi:hypothetical protein